MTDNPNGEWSNGLLPDDVLTMLGNGQSLRADIAAIWGQMVVAAASDGKFLGISSPAGGYRSLATQKDMIAHPGNYKIIAGVKLASAGSSTHGWGTCVDISTLAGNDWAIDNASDYGFVRDLYPEYPSEYNHWHYTGQYTPTAGDDMPTLANYVDDSRNPPRVLAAGVWTDVYLTSVATSDLSLTARTIASDGAILDITLNFEVSGLGEGDIVQTQFLKGHGSGDDWTIDKAFPSVDYVGSSAATQYGQHSEKLAAETGSTYGVRAQIRSMASGVTLNATQLRFLKW